MSVCGQVRVWWVIPKEGSASCRTDDEIHGFSSLAYECKTDLRGKVEVSGMDRCKTKGIYVAPIHFNPRLTLGKTTLRYLSTHTYSKHPKAGF